MTTLHDRVCVKDYSRRLNDFIVDDALIETATIREFRECALLVNLGSVYLLFELSKRKNNTKNYI